MNEEEAVSRVEEWLTDRGGEGTGALRVRREYVVRATDGWNVTYNTVGWLDGTDPAAGLFPSPVAFVPDDGGEIRLDLELMAVSAAGGEEDDAFTRWTEVVDPEFDPAVAPGLPVPKAAILRWEQYTLYGEPTGAVRANPDHRPGPRFSGRPAPESPAEALLGYLRVEWITPEEFVHWMLDLDVLAPAKDGHLQVRDFGDAGVRFVVYTSEAQVPAEYTLWQRVQPRVLLRRAKDNPGVGLLVNPGRPETFTVYPETLRQVADLDLPAGTDRPESVGRPAYFGGEYDGAAVANLRSLVDQARDNGYPLSADELARYTRAATLSFERSRAKYDGRPLPELPEDLFAAGLVTHFYDDGEPRPSAWTFGKFYNPTRRDGHRG
ncbi:YrhB domain-containing protein [Amycolatopsis sp. NPDC089917]|uniref:YrhB domain-containing protein n=1 Tax=Amycolatopsis sp. NPDC089917 TaxID=3155187 RepID=UPI003412AC91